MTSFSVWECIVCGWIYDESQGFPEDGIAPGTLWDDIPQDWSCPDCGVTKQDFEMVKSPVSAAIDHQGCFSPCSEKPTTALKDEPDSCSRGR